MARIYKKGKYYIGESERYTSSGNDPTWKKLIRNGYLVKKRHGMILSKSKSKTFVLKKLRKKGYDI